MRRMFAIAFLLFVAAPVHADTAAGVAAYDRGEYATALALLKPEAEQGDPAAQARLGLIYAKGLGVPRDPAAAVAWFRKSAEQGNAEGQYGLGVVYDVGDGRAPDPAQAAIWYRKSAEQGYAEAQYNLGHMLLHHGSLSVRAHTRAEGAAWALKAAEQGMAEAMHLYGNACGGGIGVAPDMLCARYWLRRAVAAGASDARNGLGLIEGFIEKLEAEGAPKTAGGDGSTPARAIQLPDAGTAFESVKAERAVVAVYFEGWTWRSQSLINGPEPGIYDAIELEGPDGATKTIYFDIHNWFGKME